MALASVSTFSGSVVRTPIGGEGLRQLCSQCSTVCGSSLHSGHVGSTAGSSKRAYALRSGMCPDRKRTMETTSAQFETAMQSIFLVKFSYTVAVRRRSYLFFLVKEKHEISEKFSF